MQANSRKMPQVALWNEVAAGDDFFRNEPEKAFSGERGTKNTRRKRRWRLRLVFQPATRSEPTAQRAN